MYSRSMICLFICLGLAYAPMHIKALRYALLTIFARLLCTSYYLYRSYSLHKTTCL